MLPSGFAATLFWLLAKLARHIARNPVSRGSAIDARQVGSAKDDPLSEELDQLSRLCERLKPLSALTDDRRLRFCKALEVLPRQTCVIYLLHSRHDLDFPAIASLLEITIDQVQLELAKALRLLCEAIDGE
ncbi:hypothetical protein [Novosphingobium sediminicola]|uniref:DNA-directed RNA polymerase specialized sigma24 family protein n=1 Tax=Novosphingobium sediminicola TaxID=563162 RepID=A0A7W6CNL6_9SPHN|nr:hypothetical protein [Novosphingobium sediminicola]MBB3957065.1 DNA-directed RNA polymerase specialized sigma24 family protein [Novosphingobium sediminicola]